MEKDPVQDVNWEIPVMLPKKKNCKNPERDWAGARVVAVWENKTVLATVLNRQFWQTCFTRENLYQLDFIHLFTRLWTK